MFLGYELSTNDDSLETVANELKGNTLLIYWYMIRKSRPHGAREIQRAVGLSSSSLALHHLNKLIELGLVATDRYGRYFVSQRIAPGMMSLFVGTGRFFIPRFVLYAIFFTAIFVSSAYVFIPRIDSPSVLLLFVSVVAGLIFWYEGLRMWRSQPF